MNCCSSSTTVTGTNATLFGVVHRAHAELAVRREGQRGARHPHRRRRRQRHRHLGGDAVRDVAVRIGDLDVDPIGARRRARGLRDEADLALRRMAGDEADVGRIAELEVVQLALGDLHDRDDRIERDDLRDLPAGHRERRLPDFDRHLVDHARPGRTHDAALALRLGGRKRRLGGLVLRFPVALLEPRQRALRDQLHLRLELGLALRQHGARLRDLRLARLVGQDGDDVALLSRAGRAAPSARTRRRRRAPSPSSCGPPRCGRRERACGCAARPAPARRRRGTPSRRSPRCGSRPCSRPSRAETGDRTQSRRSPRRRGQRRRSEPLS